MFSTVNSVAPISYLKRKYDYVINFQLILTPPSQKPNHCSLEKFQKSEGTIDAASL